MTRTFSHQPAERKRVPMLVGLVGASGSGKTYSALRLATGMQRATGGKIFYIDTEAKRALHYADEFDFEHVHFEPPFGPLDYLTVIEYCKGQGAEIIVIDSMSHEHEGPGGVLEMHDEQVKKLSGGDFRKADRVNMLAWAKPKAERRRLINEILRLGVNGIFCFRAKDKIKPVKGKDVLHLGWQPIAGEEFVYEMTVNCLLYPNSGGVPTWQPDEKAENAMIKPPPKKLLSLFSAVGPLSEDIGEGLAAWAAGTMRTTPPASEKQASSSPNGLNEALGWIEMASTKAELDSAMGQIKKDVAPSLKEVDLTVLRDAASRRQAHLRKARPEAQGDFKLARGGGDSGAPEIDPETGETIPDSVGK